MRERERERRKERERWVERERVSECVCVKRLLSGNLDLTLRARRSLPNYSEYSERERESMILSWFLAD